MIDRDKHNPEEVLKKIHNLDPKLKQNIMSGLQRVIQESEKRGIQLGSVVKSSAYNKCRKEYCL